MTLLITLIAAVIVTIVWYTSPKARKLKVGLMCYMYWGASIMWLVDALFEYKEQGAGYFTPATADMINDSFLGICVVALGTVVWLGTMLISDPEGIVRKALTDAYHGKEMSVYGVAMNAFRGLTSVIPTSVILKFFN